MDEQQLGGGNNWQDSHPALQSSHARGALFCYSQISCLAFLSPPFICYSYFFTDSFFCFVLVSFYLIFIPRILSFALSLPLFIQNENFLRAQRSHGRFRGNQRWTFWRWELNLKSCKKLKYLKKYFDGRNINMQKRLLTLGMKSSKIEGKQKN